MKKQIRRAMLSTIAMMLMGIVSLTGVTYAWFSESDAASVDGLTMSVTSVDGGVYISDMPYPQSFDTSIAMSIPADQLFNPVSTAGNLVDGKLQFFSGSLESPSDKTLDIGPASATGYYVEQDVYFDNSTGASDIVITLDGTEISTLGNKRTDLAARIAIVTHGHISLEEFNKQADYPVASAPTAVQIYEPNATTHTPAGHTEYKKNVNPSALQTDRFDYYGVNATGSDVNRFGEGNPAQLTKMSTITEAKEVKITVPAESYLKITVYVWLEGQDADCQNNISGETYTAAIKFTLA